MCTYVQPTRGQVHVHVRIVLTAHLTSRGPLRRRDLHDNDGIGYQPYALRLADWLEIRGSLSRRRVVGLAPLDAASIWLGGAHRAENGACGVVRRLGADCASVCACFWCLRYPLKGGEYEQWRG